MTARLAVMLLAGVLLAQVSQEIRVDTFSRHGRRTGYVIVSPTGRVDFYDQHQRHTGNGVITPEIRQLLDQKRLDTDPRRRPNE